MAQKKIYNKLVRDFIPDIIAKSGRLYESRILDDTNFLVALNAKLQEEVVEYLESGSVEELADILEVIDGILLAKNVRKNELEKIKLDKKNECGSFEKKIFLMSVKSE